MIPREDDAARASVCGKLMACSKSPSSSCVRASGHWLSALIRDDDGEALAPLARIQTDNGAPHLSCNVMDIIAYECTMAIMDI